MSTRNFLFPLTATVWLLGATAACAGDFPMSGSMLAQAGSMDTVRNVTMEPSSRSALGADSSSLPEMRGGAIADSDYAESASPRAATGNDADTTPATVTTPGAGARTAIPVATPAVPSRARSGNRWQTLVPGAIK